MKVISDWLRQSIALGLVLLLFAPFATAATTPQPQSASPQQNQNQAQRPAESQQQQGSQSGTNNAPANAAGSQLPAAPQAAQQQDQQQNQQPVGTAAAPYENPVGVAVSRPAGAAIAPAKQRRTRSFLIKMSLVIGAAVAVGTVAALSKGSPSRP